MNKQGRRARGLLAKLEQACGSVDRGPPGRVAELEELIDAGQEYVSSWQTMVHGDFVPPPRDAMAFKREFNEWGRQGMVLCRRSGVPISRLGAFTGEV